MFKLIHFLTLSLSLVVVTCFEAALSAEELKPSSTLSEEEKAELEAIGPNKWTETLKLKDFYLTSGYSEINDKLKYKEDLAKIYKEHQNVFSTAIEYGLLLIDLGKSDEAKIVWGIAEKDFFANDTPKIYKAWVQAINGDYLASKNIWYPIIKEKLDFDANSGLWLSSHIDALIGLTLIKNYLPQKDKEEVQNVVDRFGRKLQSPRLATIYAASDLQAGKIKKTIRRIEGVLSVNPNEPALITLYGITKLINGEYNEALNLFNKSIKIYPNSPTAHLMKARAFYALKNEKEAVIALEEAKNLDPGLKNLKVKKILAAKSYISRSGF